MNSNRGNPFLEKLLHAQKPEEQKVALESLLSSQADPVIKKTIRRKFLGIHGETVQDQQDVYGETILRLWKRLKKWMENQAQIDVEDFPAYVATIAGNCCNEYFRSKFPRRSHLKNRLQYLLTRMPEFEVWRGHSGELCCGLSRWKKRIEKLEKEKVLSFAEDPAVVQIAKQAQLPGAVQEILHRAGRPIALDDLLFLIGMLHPFQEQFRDAKVVSEVELEILADSRAEQDTHESLEEQKRNLERLWNEICQLPPNQRVALLLNLRDQEGREAITAFPALGIASIKRIAEILSIPLEEFAALWNDLPLADTAIAARLKLTRQQVINLRKSARERLANRMKKN